MTNDEMRDRLREIDNEILAGFLIEDGENAYVQYLHDEIYEIRRDGDYRIGQLRHRLADANAFGTGAVIVGACGWILLFAVVVLRWLS